ncbi:ABC transporter ATP-binding protein [Luteolibacter yonseiensis]|uniref:ABC transporter ATP-binding protein n=1 Tax=Luteolibacter yonseiensis TaxID=1144680 RepID=A0A934VA87_9BACT|nr:ABC transporter ATP-binding protein [Luteolibacter yonseiensis]MBK1814895.1 ABC transporter ATP-binding protein [Luteolibacter yonseiensis]
MSSPPAIDIRSLRVDYGNFVAVNDLTLQVPPGEVFGIVGPNGAGKTSTFRVLTTLMEPTYGEVILSGVDVLEDIESARRIIGYMPDLAPVPSDLKVWEFLDFHANAYGIGNRAQRRDRVAECLEEVDLTNQRDSWCNKLSRGQTQRVVLAKTLLHRPRVLILDEPASGLDPLARRDLRHALRKLAATGATVFVSSHILSELAEMCTSLCVMNRGKLLASGTVEQVREQLGSNERTLTASLLSGHEQAAEWLSAQPAVHDLQRSGQQIIFGYKGSDESQADLMAGLVRLGVRMRAFEEKRSSFEDILVEVAESNRN